MKYFLFPKCKWKYILFLLFFVFSFLQNAIIRWISWDSKDVTQPFLNTYLFNVSDYLSIIPLLIVKIRSRNKKEQEDKLEKLTSVKTNYIYYTINKTSRNFKWHVLLVAVFDFASHISSLAFYIVYGKNERSVSENNLSSLLIFNTITIYLLSRLILKTYFYRHHFFSFIINIICILILGTIDIINIINDETKGTTGMVIFYIAKKIITIICYSIEDVIGKKILMENFINIYSILFARAVFETILLILFSVPFIFINVTDRSGDIEETGIIFSRILNLFEKSNFFKIILFTITNLFYNIFIWSIIDKFSPSHYAVSNIFESFGTLMRLWITEPDSVDLPVLRMFIYFILIIGSCIHAEMIIINFCGLQKHTKFILEEKEKIDNNLINNIFDNGDPENLNNSRNSALSDISEHSNDSQMKNSRELIVVM